MICILSCYCIRACLENHFRNLHAPLCGLFNRFERFCHVDFIQLLKHHQIDDKGKQEGQQQAVPIAERQHRMRKADHIDVDLFHHKPVQQLAQQQSRAAADGSQEQILPKDIGCRFHRVEAQHLDGGNLPDALGDVDVG